ncbi:MAG: SAF domain-containing protein [Firmicutes bacterium]|nr:SAF domain-containing protein [Bacillota bacterium]
MRRIKLPARDMSLWVAVLLSIAAGTSVMIAFYQLYMPVKVLAPRGDIKVGSVIGQSDIGYITVTRRDSHSMALSDPRQVIGKYAVEKLYTGEPILSQKLSSDQKEIMGISGSLAPDETYISLKPNEARWPNGLKAGDSVTVVGVIEGGKPQVIGEGIKVIGLTGPRIAAGQIDQLKNVVTGSESSITLAMRWSQVGPFFYGKILAREIWIMPEHPAREPGGKL